VRHTMGASFQLLNVRFGRHTSVVVFGKEMFYGQGIKIIGTRQIPCMLHLTMSGY